MLKKKIFGDDHEIKYDVIINHDSYDFLRVSLEVRRDSENIANLILNGKDAGFISVIKEGGKKTVGYRAYRCFQTEDETGKILGKTKEIGIYRKLGQAVAAIIISDDLK